MKKENIFIAYLFNSIAFVKFNLTISEKARDNPVLIVGLLVKDFIGYSIPFVEKIAE
jgi:hypothetical protein